MAEGDVKVSGLKELGEVMRLVPEKLEKRIIGEATRAGTKVLVEGVRRRAPRESGELARNITATFKVFFGKGIAIAKIGVRYRRIVAASSRRPGLVPSTEDPGVYALFVEFGRPNRKGHTYQAAQPFMRPTFDQDADSAVKAFAAKIRERLGDLVG